MQSLNSCATNCINLSNLGFTANFFSRWWRLSSRLSYNPSFCRRFDQRYCLDAESFELRVRTHWSAPRHRVLQVCAMDEDSIGISSFDWGDNDRPFESLFLSSDSDNSDGEINLQPINVDFLPRRSAADDTIAVTAHRLGMLSRARKKRKKMVIPLPTPVGLVCLEKIYPSLTLFCFVSMANEINITNGLAAGAAALAFVGMSIVVHWFFQYVLVSSLSSILCSHTHTLADFAIFEASVAGACVGFLMHNRYKASIFMGDTGALALGGALAAMASCTGMFFPLFLSSGVFVLEAVSVIAQVSFFKVTKLFGRTGRQLFNMAPFHRHLELSGVEEPTKVAAAYVIARALILCAAYVGLTSARVPEVWVILTLLVYFYSNFHFFSLSFLLILILGLRYRTVEGKEFWFCYR